MTNDAEYLSNYKPDHLYTHPTREGAFATIVGESEELLGDISITERCRLAVKAFYVREKRDFSSLKITKLQFHKTHGWREDSSVLINNFQLSQIRNFLQIISSLDLQDARNARLSIENLNVGALGAILNSSNGRDLIKDLSESPELHRDIYAIAAKRKALAEFESKLNTEKISEPNWQEFFERNPWIFGHGLSYVFLDKVDQKLETLTTGSTFDRSGKRVDGLMLTRAEVSQYVLVEIKRSDTSLLQHAAYRPGCWSVSNELSGAVTQIQKTTHDFARARLRDDVKDDLGNSLEQFVYSIEPRSYLVVGCWEQLKGNDDKITCFELYRRNIRAPEILTFDELFHRAKFIVENASRETQRK